MSNAYARSGALTANVAASVTVYVGPQGLWVTNRSQAGEIWVRMDGTAATVAGNDCFVVLGARNFASHAGNVTVSLISTGTPNYEVSGAVPVA